MSRHPKPDPKPAESKEQVENTIETWIRASKVETNPTVVKVTEETENRAGELFVKVYVKA